MLLWIWFAGMFSYSLIGFQIKYIPGDIYTNTIAIAISEIFATVLSGLFLQKINAKVSMTVMLLLAGISGMYLIEQNGETLLTPALVMTTRFGVSATMNIN